MTTLLLLVFFLGLAALLMWHKLGDRTEDPIDDIAYFNNARPMREDRLDELMTAYKVAKEELGEEPTVDQIFLTRDTLRDF